MKFMIVMAVLSAVSMSIFAFGTGYKVGVHEASEHFYEECQGGEIHYKSASGEMLTAVGCAEIARHIR